MKTEYEHIHFEDVSYLYPSRKTQVWYCHNNSNIQLGQVQWYVPWRQYCFIPKDLTVLAKSCLLDICDFIKQLMENRNESKNI